MESLVEILRYQIFGVISLVFCIMKNESQHVPLEEKDSRFPIWAHEKVDSVT